MKASYVFSDDYSIYDDIGHGTCIMSIIADNRKNRMLGLASKANIFVFKVFNNQMNTKIDWLLDALELAHTLSIKIINFSFGSSLMDDKRLELKINELTSSGIIFVSSSGNRGPQYGTIQSPSDMKSVISVGSIDSTILLNKSVPNFSSRGYISQDENNPFPLKPDLITVGTNVPCMTSYGIENRTGTSYSSAIVTSLLALISSEYPHLNVASALQILSECTQLLEHSSIIDQGRGYVVLDRLPKVVELFKPHLSLYPKLFNMSDCKYFEHFCYLSLYYTSQPIYLHITVLNSKSPRFYLRSSIWKENGNSSMHNYLEVNTQTIDQSDSWTMLIRISIRVVYPVEIQTLSNGILLLSFENHDLQENHVNFSMILNIHPTPLKQYRILFDQFHNIQSKQYLNDHLLEITDSFNSRTDSLLTNFLNFFKFLKNDGYFVEITNLPLNSLNMGFYGLNHSLYFHSFTALILIVDPEQQFSTRELECLEHSFNNSILLIVDWHLSNLNQLINTVDNNDIPYQSLPGSQHHQFKLLLDHFNLAFVDDFVVSGSIHLNYSTINIYSGSLIRILNEKPMANSKIYLIPLAKLSLNQEFIENNGFSIKKQPLQLNSSTSIGSISIMSMANGDERGFKRLGIFGDSSCLEDGRMKNCLNLISKMIKHLINETDYQFLEMFEKFNHP